MNFAAMIDDPKNNAECKDPRRFRDKEPKVVVTLVTARRIQGLTLAQNLITGFLPCFFGFHTRISCT
jgi:hypothetical protein